MPESARPHRLQRTARSGPGKRIPPVERQRERQRSGEHLRVVPGSPLSPRPTAGNGYNVEMYYGPRGCVASWWGSGSLTPDCYVIRHSSALRLMATVREVPLLARGRRDCSERVKGGMPASWVSPPQRAASAGVCRRVTTPGRLQARHPPRWLALNACPSCRTCG